MFVSRTTLFDVRNMEVTVPSMSAKTLFAALLMFYFVIFVTEGQVIETTKGQVRGFQESVDVDGEERIISKFLGIPYAKPPVGDLRLEPAQEPDVWTDILDATHYPPQCIQLDAQLRKSTGLPDADRNTLNEIAKSYGRTYPSEDCLYLNVYVPRKDISSSDSLSVMVWIHDGGVIVYSANVNDGTPIALEGDIIVVAINYRLTGLGFLTVQDSNGDVVRGNLGAKDQIVAMQWVKDNIANFGGNPNSVTLCGTSAGGGSAVSHSLSPMTRGLFHRVISTSGSPNHIPWAQDDAYKAFSRYFIESVGCKHNDTDTMLRCLKDLPVEAYSGAPRDIILNPVIDGEFIPANPEHLLKTEQIHSVKDIMLGCVNGEGTFVMDKDAYTVLNEDLLAQMLAPFASIYSKNDPEQIKSIWWYEYVSGATDTASYQEAYNQLHADIMLSTTVRNIEYMIQAGVERVYQFYFTHQSSDSAWPAGIGASHGSDVKFVLPRQDSVAKATPEELAMGKMWRRAWSNFVKTGYDDAVKNNVYSRIILRHTNKLYKHGSFVLL